VRGLAEQPAPPEQHDYARTLEHAEELVGASSSAGRRFAVLVPDLESGLAKVHLASAEVDLVLEPGPVPELEAVVDQDWVFRQDPLGLGWQTSWPGAGFLAATFGNFESIGANRQSRLLTIIVIIKNSPFPLQTSVLRVAHRGLTHWQR
jgi:hypothetical protein